MSYDKKKFLDASGKRVITGLFKEFARCDVKFKPWATLEEWKQLFLECRDPSEYKAAMTIVGDWEHWQEIRNHLTIKPHVDKWQEELAIKLRSEAITSMIGHAKAQGGTAAAKWLADKGYAVEGFKGAVGRPKKEVEGVDSDAVDKRAVGDLKRLGLIAGGKR